MRQPCRQRHLVRLGQDGRIGLVYISQPGVGDRCRRDRDDEVQLTMAHGDRAVAHHAVLTSCGQLYVSEGAGVERALRRCLVARGAELLLPTRPVGTVQRQDVRRSTAVGHRLTDSARHQHGEHGAAQHRQRDEQDDQQRASPVPGDVAAGEPDRDATGPTLCRGHVRAPAEGRRPATQRHRSRRATRRQDSRRAKTALGRPSRHCAPRA